MAIEFTFRDSDIPFTRFLTCFGYFWPALVVAFKKLNGVLLPAQLVTTTMYLLTVLPSNKIFIFYIIT